MEGAVPGVPAGAELSAYESLYRGSTALPSDAPPFPVRSYEPALRLPEGDPDPDDAYGWLFRPVPSVPAMSVAVSPTPLPMQLAAASPPAAVVTAVRPSGRARRLLPVLGLLGVLVAAALVGPGDAVRAALGLLQP